MDASAPRSRPLPLRRIAWAGGVLLVLYVAYLAAGNAFLHSDLARELLSRKPEKFRMDWSGGQTWWPGHVVLRDVRMQGHVRRTQWSVQAEGARGRIALWPLLRKQVRVPWVQADGVTGSVARAGRELPRPDHRPGGWTLQMDRIVSDSIRGGEVFGWTIAGNGQTEVGFRKQFRGGPAELLPSFAHFDSASASREGEEWLRAARVNATFALASHLSSEYAGWAKLPLFSASLDIDGRTMALRSVLDEAGRYRFDAMPGEGRVAGRLVLARGELGQGGQLRLHTPLHSVGPDGVARTNALDLQLDVDEGLRLHAQVPEQPGHDIALDVDLQLPGRALPLQDWRARLAKSTGSARGRWHVPSIGALVALFAQADWLRVEGSGTVEADLKLADGRLAEGSRLQVRGVEARADVLGNRFSGRAQADAVIEAGEGGEAISRVALAMQRFAAAPAGTPSKPYVEGNDLRVELRSAAQLDRMRDTSRARIRFADARVPDLALFNSYLPNEKLRFDGGSGRVSGDLQVEADGDVGEGMLKVDARQARVVAADLRLRGDIAIDGHLRRGNLEQGEFALGGTQVRLRNVAFTERGGQVHAGWWATLDLGDGKVGWKRPSHAGGNVQARMRDAGFLLAMFADRTEFPAWIGRLVDAGEARVRGHWLWRDDRLVLDRVHAQNDRFEVDARLQMQGQAHKGDLYVKWGVLGVGVELHDGTRKMHLRKAREWYDGRPDLL